MTSPLPTLLTMVLLAACAQPPPDASPTPLPELAVEPTAIATAPAPPATPSGASTSADEGASRSPDDPGRDPGSAAPSPASEPTATSEPGGDTESPETPRGYTTILTFDDPAGDEGLEAPGYADVRSVSFQDDGERLRVWVDLGADVPRQLDDGEVMGLGVDLYLDGGDESDYQLFADGGSDGWQAYFQTPRGFVSYPGTFAMGGRRIEFTVPWSSMGTPPRGESNLFIDWSRVRPVVNAAGSDQAPDREPAGWAR